MRSQTDDLGSSSNENKSSIKIEIDAPGPPSTHSYSKLTTQGETDFEAAACKTDALTMTNIPNIDAMEGTKEYLEPSSSVAASKLATSEVNAYIAKTPVERPSVLALEVKALSKEADKLNHLTIQQSVAAAEKNVPKLLLPFFNAAAPGLCEFSNISNLSEVMKLAKFSRLPIVQLTQIIPSALRTSLHSVFLFKIFYAFIELSVLLLKDLFVQ